MEYKVLIADDCAEALRSFEYQLKPHAHIVPVLVNSAADALAAVKKSPNSFAAIVLDFHFHEEGVNGAQLVAKIKEIKSTIQIIICTGDDSREALQAGFHAKVEYFICKDDIEAFMSSLEKCFRSYDENSRILSEHNISLKSKYEQNESYIKAFGLIGRSDRMRKVCETIDLCKDEKSTVLIRGESGTGKELVARAFHEKSKRSSKKFVAINCAALPADLLESELFGHQKGAFTGADQSKIGKFELADRGTLFLDEVGDMPLDLQAKLLRVLQEGTFYPVGAREEIHVDVRVIAATNVNLEKAVERGHFRQDLYYRLKVIELQLPPLRERTEDIDLLALHFQKKHAPNSNKNLLYAAVEELKKYSWTGNVRELENVIQRVFALSSEENIGPASLPQFIFDSPKTQLIEFCIDTNGDYSSFCKSVDEFVQKQEYDFITKKVQSEKSIRRAATKLNLSKSALHRKLVSLGYEGKEIHEKAAQ